MSTTAAAPAEVLEELGAALAHLEGNVAQVKAELKTRIREAHEAGVPKKDIAALAGVSRPTVDKWLGESQRTWRASCEACGWEQRADDYASAGDAARGHSDDCPDASTCVDWA